MHIAHPTHLRDHCLAPERVDARRDRQTVLPLASLNPATNDPLPITDPTLIQQFVVPPFSPLAAIEATSTVPITLDVSPSFGTPDVEAFSLGDGAIAVPTASELPASIWSCAPAEQGPFPGTSTPSAPMS